MQNHQAPIGSGLGPATTAREALGNIDLTGKIAIVTGGSAGLGLETTRVLAEAGAAVIVPARDLEKARKAVVSTAGVQIETLDLLDPASIDAFANRFVASGWPLDILINNAGIMANPLSRDARGYESQFATNHLGHFHLAVRLWPALLRAEGARVVSLSSRGHWYSAVDFDDPNYDQRTYDKWLAYAQSKTANALFTVGLDARGEAHGVRAFSVHPGTIFTDLAKYLSDEEIAAFDVYDENGHVRIDPDRDLKTIAQGAATTVWCATSPQLKDRGGLYCENCDVAIALDAKEEKPVGVRPWATDQDAAERLWHLSERLTGVRL
jgi:NAD(P)-dependent dehydrogenase (short-subunit alcohol dehydrogenase family)